LSLNLRPTHHLLGHIDDVNLLGENINKNREALLVHVSKEVSPEENAEKMKYMFISRHRAAGKLWYETANTSFGNVTKFRYLGVKLTNLSYVHE
jgi:hypothetical protein